MRYSIAMHFHMIDGRIVLLAFLWFMWSLEILSGFAITTLRSFSTRAENSGRFWIIILVQAAILAIFTIYVIWHFIRTSSAA